MAASFHRSINGSAEAGRWSAGGGMRAKGRVKVWERGRCRITVWSKHWRVWSWPSSLLLKNSALSKREWIIRFNQRRNFARQVFTFSMSLSFTPAKMTGNARDMKEEHKSSQKEVYTARQEAHFSFSLFLCRAVREIMAQRWCSHPLHEQVPPLQTLVLDLSIRKRLGNKGRH